MVCPSCNKDLDSTTVCSCGARCVGAPLTASIYPVPRLVYGITALLVIVVVVAVQATITIKNLYLTDLKWQWELFLTTSYLAKFLLPVVMVATFLACCGLRLASRRPSEYGGARLSRYCLALSLLLFLLDGGALAGRLPDMLESRKLKQRAYTEAMMYKLNLAVAKYREQYGAYPERLIDLQEMDPTMRPVLDYWDHALVYTPMSSDVASRVSPVPFQNYELISRGGDGILGTEDDIVMRDGLMIPASSSEMTEQKAGDPLRK
ncbi:MAG: hypothetical protein HY314_05170 [Acidobacteria bacterium]|nr:hypothetical protein [Acidobacteriota bacterium]